MHGDLKRTSDPRTQTPKPQARVLQRLRLGRTVISTFSTALPLETTNHDSVTYRPIARQRLGKHILAQAYARINRTSTARQRVSKHASLTIEAVFCVVRAKWL
jgi:hypothetical protein